MTTAIDKAFGAAQMLAKKGPAKPQKLTDRHVPCSLPKHARLLATGKAVDASSPAHRYCTHLGVRHTSKVAEHALEQASLSQLSVVRPLPRVSQPAWSRGHVGVWGSDPFPQTTSSLISQDRYLCFTPSWETSESI